MMSDFYFVGQVPSSKSLLNRALLLQDHFKDLEINGDSTCNDVSLMKKGLKALSENPLGHHQSTTHQHKSASHHHHQTPYQTPSMISVDCGDAGTVLRFLALRASRVPGEYLLHGSKRLFSRPQTELVAILRQLGMEVQLGKDSMKIKSWGWKIMGDAIHINSSRSSQFASAVLLNAWGLNRSLHFSLSHQMVSSSYWNMTLKLIHKLGLHVESWENEYTVPPRQTLYTQEYLIEPDMDCMFALAALAAVSGTAIMSPHLQIDTPEDPANDPSTEIHSHTDPFSQFSEIKAHPSLTEDTLDIKVLSSNKPSAKTFQTSLQPDRLFIHVLKQMNVPVGCDSQGNLRVQRASQLKAIELNMKECPDMFPVLAALCGRAQGVSFLHGAQHLRYKESHRILKMAELLQKIGCDIKLMDDGLTITGASPNSLPTQEFSFNTDCDHRLAMAAGVLKKSGIPIHILHPEVVDKSFPGFWSLSGL